MRDQTDGSLLPVTSNHPGTKGGEPVTVLEFQGYTDSFCTLIIFHVFDTILSMLPGTVSSVS